MLKIISKALSVAVAMAFAGAPAIAADASAGQDNGILLQRAAGAKFVSAPGVPACTSFAPLRGDMGKGASTLMVRMKSGCLVPYHWHTPSEEIVVLQGSPYAQMMGLRPYYLKVGSYSQLPSHHMHRFKCVSRNDCLMFLVADGAFDIHFVDDQGTEISTDAALEAAKKSDVSKW
jgi:quercetin dioxygenase-like cupin family protein